MSAPAPADFADAVFRDCLDAFALVRLRVRGDCMAPHLVEGDVVELAPPARRRPRLGDVVLVRLPAGYRLHRVVWAGRTRRTKADRGRFCDPGVPPRDVMATVVARERGGRRRPHRRSLAAVVRSLLRLRRPR
jgi:hypothetical protein